MEGIVTGFVELIRNAVLSGFFVYALLFGMLLLTTLGSFGNWRKVAAHILGWLAAVTALAGTLLFLMSLTGGEVRALISSGTIAFAIGALVHIVMRGTLIKSFMETPVQQAN